MTWGKLDDGFWRHPKVRAAARRDHGAVGLLAQAISLAAEYETDGRITEHHLEELCPRVRLRRKLVRILTSCGLLDHADGGGYLIHDFLDYNPSRADLERERQAGRRRKRRERYGTDPGGEAQVA